MTVKTVGIAPPPLDVDAIRKDFPILHQRVHDGKRLAYLDSAATTQKPAVVINSIRDYYEGYNSNVHRALHVLAEKATETYEASRREVAAFLNAPGEETIVFTRGTTEGINLVAYAWGRSNVSEGDEIILTEMEHHSNIVPWQMLAQEKGARLRYIPFHEDGTLDLDVYSNLLSEKTRLVAVTHMSNVLGTINPIGEIVRDAHRVGAKVLVDGAQGVAHCPVDVQALDVDFLACSGHKVLGPTGIGALYGKEELLDAMPPFMGGGEMILKVKPDVSTYADLPYKFEAGTPNIAGAIGFGEALRYVKGIGQDAMARHEADLIGYGLDRLAEVPGLRVIGSAPERGGVLSFTLEGVHPHDVSQFVDREGVAIRAGHMCCQLLLRACDVQALNRASFYVYNTREDVDQLAEALVKVKEYFGV